MTIPSNSTYDEATVLNPSSAVTDFSLLVDLSRMSDAWWSAAENTNKRRMRFSKDDGTELPFDPMEYDHASRTGWVRVKWTGSLAASGTQKLRVYPPVSTNSIYTDNNTYGKDNAYDANWVNYWPFIADDVNRIGSGLELVAASGVPSPSISTVGGRLAMDFDGTMALVSTTNNPVYKETTVIVNYYGRVADAYIVCEAYNDHRLRANRYMHSQNTPRPEIVRSSAETLNTWSHLAISTDTTTHAEYYVDGVDDTDVGTSTATPWPAPTDQNRGTNKLSLASRDSGSRDYTDGAISHLSEHDTDRSAAFIEQEYDQTNYQAAFWGTWTNVPVPTTTSYNRVKGSIKNPVLIGVQAATNAWVPIQVDQPLVKGVRISNADSTIVQVNYGGNSDDLNEEGYYLLGGKNVFIATPNINRIFIKGGGTASFIAQ